MLFSKMHATTYNVVSELYFHEPCMTNFQPVYQTKPYLPFVKLQRLPMGSKYCQNTLLEVQCLRYHWVIVAVDDTHVVYLFFILAPRLPAQVMSRLMLRPCMVITHVLKTQPIYPSPSF
jgi:hypothetical protein